MKEVLLDIFHLRESMQTNSIEEVIKEIRIKVKNAFLEERKMVLQKLNSIEERMEKSQNKTFDQEEFIKKKKEQFSFLGEKIENILDNIEMNYKKLSFSLFSNTRILNMDSIRESKELLDENKKLKKEMEEIISFLLDDSKDQFYELENRNVPIDQESIDELREKGQEVTWQDQPTASFSSNEKITDWFANTSTIDSQIKNQFNGVFEEPEKTFEKNLSYLEKLNLDQPSPFTIDDQNIIAEFDIISNEPSRDFEKRLSYVNKMNVEQISSFANESLLYKEENRTPLYNEEPTNHKKDVITTSDKNHSPHLSNLEGLAQKLFESTMNPLPLKIKQEKGKRGLSKSLKKFLRRR